MDADRPTPDRIMDVGLGFFESQTLLTAVELDVFTELADEPATCEELRETLDLHPRGAEDFFDALVALGFLEREDGVYRNAPDADRFLDAQKEETYIGGILKMARRRGYPLWGNLPEALRTGEPQNELRDVPDADLFEAVYADEDRLREFAGGMSSLSKHASIALAETFRWEEYDSLCDLGCAEGVLPITIARHHEHVTAAGFDLPPLEPLATERIEAAGLEDRVTFHAGDFFEEDLPEHDVFTIGHTLHNWGLEKKLELLESVYDALPEDGAVIVYERLIDDDRRENAAGLLMSLTMLLETQDGFDFTGADCQDWMAEVGFTETEVVDLPGDTGAVIGYK